MKPKSKTEKTDELRPEYDLATLLEAGVRGKYAKRYEKGKPMTTKVLNAHIPLPLAEKVDQFAARQKRSRTWIIKQALSAWIDHEEERQRLTIEAMADVDAGRVIDHKAVQEWAESLSTETPLPLPQ